MADFQIPTELISNIKGFVALLKTTPSILDKPELSFLKEYLLSLGATLPTTKANQSAGGDTKVPPKTPPPSANDVEFEEVEEEDPPEPYPELDVEGVIEPDQVNLDQEMGDLDAEVTEEAMDKSNEHKVEAVGLFNEEKYEESIQKYTEAIKLNSGSALLFAKRGQAFIKLNKPNACIRDCNRALQINPDSAVSYKFRGRAHRLLGHWIEAANDLRQACKIDFDEQADAWLKEVTPNARKLEEWQLRKHRNDEEKELKQRKRRAQERARAQQEARQHQKEYEGEDDDGPGAGGGGGFGSVPGLDKLMSDPEVLELFADPEVTQAFADISQNPMNIMKYQNNPKVAKLMKIMQSKMGGFGGGMPFGMGGMPGGFGGMPGGFGGMPGGMPGGAPPSSDSAPKGPTPGGVTDDLD